MRGRERSSARCSQKLRANHRSYSRSLMDSESDVVTRPVHARRARARRRLRPRSCRSDLQPVMPEVGVARSVALGKTLHCRVVQSVRGQVMFGGGTGAPDQAVPGGLQTKIEEDVICEPAGAGPQLLVESDGPGRLGRCGHVGADHSRIISRYVGHLGKLHAQLGCQPRPFEMGRKDNPAAHGVRFPREDGCRHVGDPRPRERARHHR